MAATDLILREDVGPGPAGRKVRIVGTVLFDTGDVDAESSVKGCPVSAEMTDTGELTMTIGRDVLEVEAIAFIPSLAIALDSVRTINAKSIEIAGGELTVVVDFLETEFDTDALVTGAADPGDNDVLRFVFDLILAE